MFLCRKSKTNDKEGNPESEKIEARDNGIDNSGMEEADVETKDENNEQVCASDPKRWSLKILTKSRSLFPFHKGTSRNPILIMLESIRSRRLMFTRCSALDMLP